MTKLSSEQRNLFDHWIEKLTARPLAEQTTVLKDVIDPTVRELLRLALAEPPSPRGLEPEMSVGKCCLIDRMGAGGCGEVWLARQESAGIDREVVVKFIRSDHLSGTTGDLFRDRFREEIEKLVKLNHPNIAQVYDWGIETLPGFNRPLPYLVLEKVDGKPITAALRSLVLNRSSDREGLVSCFKQLCLAIEHAHEHQLIHLDLKPANILVKLEVQPRFVCKVIDFGLAQRFDAAHPLKRDRLGEGTVPYMAPEQLNSELNGPDFRADVHAIGVVLYEVLTGRLPYRVPEGETSRLATAIRSAPRRKLSEVQTGLPAGLEELVDKAIEIQPKDRFAKPSALADALGEWLKIAPNPGLSIWVELCRPHLERLKTDCVKLNLNDVGSKEDEFERAARLTLNQVYIGLDTSSSRKDGKPLSVLEAVRENRSVVLLGNPGSGKTTFLNHLCYCLAVYHLGSSQMTLENTGEQLGPLVQCLPVLVTLRRWVGWIARNLTKPTPAEPPKRVGKPSPKPETQFTQTACVEVLWKYLEDDFNSQACPEVVPALQKAADSPNGHLILFLDGLDEVPNQEFRGYIRDVALAWERRYPASRLVVTCRTIPYQDKRWQLPKIDNVEIAPLSLEKSQAFVTAWFRAHVEFKVLKPDQADLKISKLNHAIADPLRPDLGKISENPMLLTNMALLQTLQRELPDHRANLYDEVIQLLLRRWDSAHSDDGVMTPGVSDLLHRVGADDNDLDRVLRRVAWDAQRGSLGGNDPADIPRHVLHKALLPLAGEEGYGWADDVVTVISHRSGLLLPSEEDVFRFPHRSFQEFLAAAYLLNPTPDESDSAILGEVPKDPLRYPENVLPLLEQWRYWLEVIQWSAGKATHVDNQPELCLTLLNELCPEEDPLAHVPWGRILVAGEVLLEMNLKKAERLRLGKTLVQRIRRLLKKLMAAPKTDLSPTELATVGRILGRIGDDRPGVVPQEPFSLENPMFDWCRVHAPEGGKFPMGESSDRFLCTLVQRDFWLSRHLVTVAQFALFTNNGGYGDSQQPRPRWWSQTGWAWRCQYEIGKPRAFSPGFEIANHPQVGVSWYEADAFCRWLTQHYQPHEWGLNIPIGSPAIEIRLPTESEWEFAATAGGTHRYPWGNDRGPVNYCNSAESGIKQTTAVGLFHLGNADCGAADMAGNVWEWCSTKWLDNYRGYDQRASNDPEGDATRVVRGGSWGNNEGLVRGGCRDGNRPYNRSNVQGFRLAASPISAL